MLTSIAYQIYHCKIHKKHIHFFKEDAHRTGLHHCWDCLHDEIQKKSKQERKLLEAKSQFAVDYAHLLVANLEGGIVAIKIKDNGLIVEIISSIEANSQVPNTYQDFKVIREIVGEQ
jgi:hypothetical protein